MGQAIAAINFIHPDKYALALKACEKYVATEMNRPVLTYINCAEGGEMVATDSHRAIRIKNAHGFESPTLVQPKYLNMATGGNFPDTSRIYPEESHIAIVLNQNQLAFWHVFFKQAAAALKKDKSIYSGVHSRLLITLNFYDLSYGFATTNGMKFDLPCEEYSKPENMEKIAFNIQYMIDALESHITMCSLGVKLKFTGKMSPFLVDNDNDVQALVLPVRTNG